MDTTANVATTDEVAAKVATTEDEAANVQKMTNGCNGSGLNESPEGREELEALNGSKHGMTKMKQRLAGGGSMCVDGNYAVAHVSYRVNDTAVS
jgi:alpha-D-ribose 1-methylphosphonate 5-triphosphate synthase subunit PhnG